MMNISVVVPKMPVMEALTPAYRLFTSANQFLQMQGKTPKFQVEFVGENMITKAQEGEYSVTAHRTFDDVKNTDVIIIPALFNDVQTAVEVNNQAIAWIQKMYQGGSEVASLCTGAFLLAETGLVDHKKCSTHWAYYDLFTHLYKKVDLVDGKIITDEKGIYSSGGALSIWNLLLYLLEKYTDRATAILAAKFFAVDIDRSDQGMFTVFNGQKDHADNDILKCQSLIEEKFNEQLSIGQLANYVTMHRRTFERRFKNATNNTVVEYIQRVRIEAAKRKFESTNNNVSEVMMDVGYSDTKSFRNIFKRYTGLTPLEYRRKYGKVG